MPQACAYPSADSHAGLFCDARKRAALITSQYRHHAVLRGQLQFVDTLLLHFFFDSQIVLAAKFQKFVFKLQMFFVHRLELVVVAQMLLDEFFLSALHTPSDRLGWPDAATASGGRT